MDLCSAFLNILHGKKSFGYNRLCKKFLDALIAFLFLFTLYLLQCQFGSMYRHTIIRSPTGKISQITHKMLKNFDK